MTRQRLLGNAGIAALLAIAPVAIVQPASAQVDKANEVYEEGLSINGDIATLRNEINQTSNGLPASYACPPGTPDRSADLAQLQAFKQRRTRLNVRIRRLQDDYDTAVNFRNTLGNPGADRLASLGFGPANISAMTTAIQRVSTQIGALEQAIANRPKTQAECDGTDDPVASITFAPPSAEPGRRVNAAVSATTASGKPVNINSVTVTGLDAFATLQNTRTPGGAASIQFKIDAVRRQGPFPISITVQGTPPGAPAGTTGTRHTQRFSYRVANAAPRIVSLPHGPSADPGEDVSISDDIVIIDTNADNLNGNEIRSAGVKLDGHPDGLSTTPDNAFDRNVVVSNRRHDPATGQYTFKIERSAAAKYPHPHGQFGTSMTVTDKDGKSATQDLSITVRNTPPEPVFTSPRPPENAFHSGDGKSVSVSGTVKDANGRADIKSIEIDATAAGGGTYRMFDGVKTLDVTPIGDDSVRFRIEPAEFKHTDDSGRHEITGSAGDDGAPEQSVQPSTTPFSAFITVGNTAPEVGAIGFLSGTQVIPAKRICPSDFFTAAAQVKDAEGDTLKVTATILPGGQPQVLTRTDGSNTYVADIQAPAAPGEYTIRFDAVETGTNDPKKHLRSMELKVDVCGDPKEEPKVALGEDPAPDSQTGIASGQPPVNAPATPAISVSGSYGEFDADGIGEVSAGTLVPSAGGDEQALATAELEKWDGWNLGASINGPAFRGKPTRVWIEYGQYASDTDQIANDPEAGEFGVALTYAQEFAYDEGGVPMTSTGLFLGDPFALDGSAQGEGDLYYLKFGVDKLKWSNDQIDLRGGVFGFHRTIETDLWSNAAVSFGGSPFGNIAQTNQIQTDIEHIGAGLSGLGTLNLLRRDGFQPGLSVSLGGLLEIMNSDAEGRFSQVTLCDPGVCGPNLSNVTVNEDFDDSGFEVGGALRLGANLDITDFLSVGAGYRIGVIPGVPTYDQPVSPTEQPGEWSKGSADYDGFDLSLRLRAPF